MTQNPPRRRFASAVHRLGLTAAFLCGTLPGFGQTSSAGTITGRILNPATQEYVRDAQVRVEGTNISVFSENGGYYTLRNVPAGEVTVVVNYTGLEPGRATVSVAAGERVLQDFNLRTPRFGGAAADGIVQLDEFVVATEREGNSKAIMEQKAAITVKNVVAADSFGDIAEGNIGEFLKFMPGITLDYVETDTRAARMGGLEARYGAVTLDGNAVANAGGSSRQFEFEAMSINNIEAIEVNKTLSADMLADAPAGSINLRTKSALDRNRSQFNFTVGFIGNQYEHSFSKTPRHDDAKHAKSRPTFSFDYSDTFFNRKLGVTLNGGYTTVFKPQYRQSLSTDYNSTLARARQAPIITAINFKDGVKMTDKKSVGLKLDFQPGGRELRFTLATSYIDFSDEIANRNFAFRVNAAQNDPSSTLTRVIANPSPNVNTRVDHTGGHGNKQIDTTNLALGFVYQGNNYTLDGQASYSRARLQNGSDHMGQVDRADLRLTRISWMAERPSIDSPSWTFTQLSGPDWSDFDSYGSGDAHTGNVRTGRSTTKTQQFVEQLNFKYNLPWERPAFIKTGVYHQVMTRSGERRDQTTQTWVGPTGNSLTSPMPESIANFRISPAFGGNIHSLPVPDKTELFNLLSTHPEYFTRTEANMAGDLDSILGGRSQSVEEQIKSAYVMGNTKFGRFQFQAGIRYEGTDTIAYNNIRIPDAENPFANNTVNRILYRWSLGRERKEGKYHDYLPSAAATYRFSEDLILKVGYHKAIKRPPLDQLAGNWSIDEANMRISVPRADLQPERSQKVSAMLEYYFEPAGTVSVHIFQTELKNSAQRTDWMDAAAFGITDPIYEGWEFRGWENIPGTRKVKGIELNYNQRLVFLPGEFLRGTSVFATYARQNSNPRPNGFVPQNATGGLYFRYKAFNARIAGTWTDDKYTGGNTVPTSNNDYFFPGDREVEKERFIFDVGAGFKVTRHLELFVDGRNAFNSGKTWYYKHSDGRIRQMEKYGGQWTIGLKGRY